MKEIDRQTNEQNQKRKDWEKQLLSKDEAIRQLTQHREDGQQSIKLKDKKIEELKKEINQLRAVINAAENDKKLLAEQIEGLTKKSQGYDKLV